MIERNELLEILSTTNLPMWHVSITLVHYLVFLANTIHFDKSKGSSNPTFSGARPPSKVRADLGTHCAALSFPFSLIISALS